jgi:hypothetical protein
MLDDKQLDKLWSYIKKSKAKPDRVILESPDKSVFGLMYLLLIQSVSFKGDYVQHLLDLSKQIKVLTQDIINDVLAKAALIADVVNTLTNKKGYTPNPKAVKIIQYLGKVQVHALIKYILTKDGITTESEVDTEFMNLESKYIEILESTVDTIDYSSVENLFNSTEIKNGTAEALYQMILDQEQASTLVSVDRKINKLFEKRLIIPITDEFMRYHKDSERIDTSDATKKIDKIRYTVSKLHQVMNHYSNKAAKQSMFYPPLAHRKVVLYNDTDEINAIMKLVKMGKTAIRSNENFSDLVSYREYPYLNFNDFNTFGFHLKFNQTTDAIRAVNFEFTENNKSTLQWRVGGLDFKVNIVGLALPRYVGDWIPNKSVTNRLQCINVKQTKNLRDIYKNAYDIFVKKLEHLVVDKTVYNKMGYWLFDKNTDKIKFTEFSEMNELNFEQYFKLMVGSLYDKITEMGYFRLKQSMPDNITLYDAIHLIDKVEREVLPLTDYLPYIYQDVIYEKTQQHSADYDTNEDKIPGLNTKIKQVPRIKQENEDLLRVRIEASDTTTSSDYQVIPENAVCQHTISWNAIRESRKSSNYNQMLFEFIKRYVRDSANNEYICKSCYQVIDIKKYVNDYSSSTEGVTMSFALESQLDKMPEYDKYNRLIKYMDKIIERFAYVANIPYYIGNLPQIKLRRQEIIRRIIDFANIQYATIKNITPAERAEREKKYGITKDHNNFFVFELKNEIFTTSSKDTDKFKVIKRHNMYAYMALFIIIEFNINQIYTLNDVIKFREFTKNGRIHFDKILIRVDNANSINPISKYPILCYCIYVAAMVLIKSKLWNEEPKIAVKSVINTVTDMLNTMLEISVLPEKDYRYELFATNFFTKLSKIFNQDDMFAEDNLVIQKDKQKVTAKDVPLTGTLTAIQFDDTIPVIKAAFNTSDRKMDRPSGLESKEIQNLEKDLHIQYLHKLFNIYTLDGNKRPESSLPTDDEIKSLTLPQLEKMYKEIVKKKVDASVKTQNKVVQYNSKIDADLQRQKDEGDKTQTKATLFDVVEEFVNKVEAIIGPNVNINNNNLYLTKNAYIIHFDIKGNRLKEPMVALEGEKNFAFKKGESNFKTDVYMHTDTKTGASMYFHAKELYFLGFRDPNGKMNKQVQKHSFLQINYSLMNKLLFLGYESLYIDTAKLPDVTRQRITNLKNCLIQVNKLIYQVKNRSKESDDLIKEYISKFKAIDTGSDPKIFGNMYDVINGSFYVLKKHTRERDETVYARYLLKHENTDHDLIKYMCGEMSRLLDLNQDKYNKVNLGFLLMTIVDNQFNRFYSKTTIHFNNGVKLAKLLAEYTMVQIYDDEDELVDRLIKEQDEETRTDNIEESEALDATQDAPEEGDDMGDEDVVFMPDY